ncbi:gliding motility lipoprotein GldD [Roseivirga misakiensis]|uniref:Gliding motility lipoprotein GldD n=1 Tax=Roseivirga misakiensis TaxID=1563681 RepID=A0A1E5T7B4_9BACT|nr:gliding motility lipoprotein GldD [Roseivirga misakiensis]
MLQCLILTLVVLSSCEEVYLPKPKGYNRIDLPNPAYQALPDTFPYQFDYSTYAELLGDSNKRADRYWSNLYYPDFDALVQITYKDLTQDENDVGKLLNESFALTMKHDQRAYGIDESLIKIPNNQVASVTKLEGEVPTQLQFFTSDSTRHFFRGALYFNTATKNDSLQPIIDFITEDVLYMLNSFEWRY